MSLKPKSSILSLNPYIPLKEGRMNDLRLDFNENTQGASPKVIEALQTITKEELSCYPEYEDFNRALAQFWSVEKNCVLPTNGSDEAIRILFETYVDKEEEVILLTPSYSLYAHFAQIVGAKIILVPYLEDFSFPLEKVLQAINAKTRLIALATPNNPTGTWIDQKDVERIIKANPNMLVLLDEAYSQFAKMTHIHLIRSYSNVFITKTFSKAYGLAGLRIGALISSKENIQVLSTVLSPTYSVDRVAIVAVLAAIEDKDYYDQYIKDVIIERTWFIEEMSRLGFDLIPSVANFVLVNFKEFAEPLRVFLEKNKILVRGLSLKGYLRITIGTKEQMQRVVERVKFFLQAPALIFDMDGVLIDESQSYRSCIQKTVEYFSQCKISLSTIETFKQSGGLNNDYDCTQSILSELGVKVDFEKMKQCFDSHYEELKYEERWLLNEEILFRIKGQFRLGIFTGRPKKEALEALKRFNKEAFFEIVITDDDVKKRKPDPEGISIALQHLGIKTAIYLGDTQDDYEAAKRACIDFIGVIPPKGSKETWLNKSIFLEDICEIERTLCQKEK